MPRLLSTSRPNGEARTSCLVFDLVFEWRLTAAQGDGTRLTVHVELPEAEAGHVAT